MRSDFPEAQQGDVLHFFVYSIALRHSSLLR